MESSKIIDSFLQKADAAAEDTVFTIAEIRRMVGTDVSVDTVLRKMRDAAEHCARIQLSLADTFAEIRKNGGR